MKTQIRKNVFETNSSSNHALCIKRNAKDEMIQKIYDIVDNGIIVLGKTDPEIIKDLSDEVVNIAELDMQKKVDILFYSAFVEYEKEDFVKWIWYVKKQLEPYADKVVCDIENMQKAVYDYWACDMFEHIIKKLKPENMFEFLFSDYCYFTSWDDDCGYTEPEAIIDIEEEFFAFPKEERLHIHDRC